MRLRLSQSRSINIDSGIVLYITHLERTSRTVATALPMSHFNKAGLGDMDESLPNYYQALGVDERADAATIKKNYRKLVRSLHPDRISREERELTMSTQLTFHDVQQAWETLGDDESRSRYDAMRTIERLRSEGRRREAARGETRTAKIDTPKPIPINLRHPLSRSSISDRSQRDTTQTQSCHRAGEGRQPERRYEEPVHGTVEDNFQARTRFQGLQGVSGYIGGHMVIALSDTGANKNLIHEKYVIDLEPESRKLKPDESKSFVIGNGNKVQPVGAVDCRWEFFDDSESVNITLYILSECIFDVVLGQDFLYSTETITSKRHRLSPLTRPPDALKIQLVNLCGTPVQCLRGTLDSTECLALPDSGAEPNLIAYEFAEAQGWLLDMHQGPKSCRLLQFIDGSTASVSGRLKLHWSFLTGWGPARSSGTSYFVFDVLRGCPFDVVLGCDFLHVTDTFGSHIDSMLETVRDGSPGLNIVVWVKSKLAKKAPKSSLVSRKDLGPEEKERERHEKARKKHEEQRQMKYAELHRRANSEWPSFADRWDDSYGTGSRWVNRSSNPQTNSTVEQTAQAARLALQHKGEPNRPPT